MNPTILFDLDGTLYSYKNGHQAGLQGAYKYWLEITNDSFDQFLEKYLDSRKTVKRFLSGTVGSHSRVLYFQGMVENDFQSSRPYHIAELTQRYWDTFINSIEPFEEVENVLQNLQKRGFRMAIVTNMSAEIQFRKLHQLNLDNYFVAVITSEEAGKEKPHPHIYFHTIDRLRVKPEDCIMIGDNWEHDVEAAEFVGMNAIQVEIEDQDPRNTSKSFANYSELPEVLDKVVEEPLEGVIKYELKHRDAEMKVHQPTIEPLIELRDELWRLNLIGVYPPDHYLTPNVGFGNASLRFTENNQFLISGSQTGNIEHTSIEDYSLVLDFEIKENNLRSKGPIKPSSESLTHAAVYEIAPEINYVIHVHHKGMWDNYDKLGMSTTPEDIPYGTPEMARAIQTAYHNEPQLSAPVCMLGHTEGLLTWGTTRQEALQPYLDALTKLDGI